MVNKIIQKIYLENSEMLTDITGKLTYEEKLELINMIFKMR
ncbi:hypothetical protein [Clostridium sp. SM-530-WT-3G]|nr:hypothetical protein [Clostridium sp. SM-530-WT-3G]